MTVQVNEASCTGKKVVTHFIHRHGKQAEKHLHALNCATLSKDAIENE
jgi:DNA-binding NtrC family response regulator